MLLTERSLFSYFPVLTNWVQAPMVLERARGVSKSLQPLALPTTL